MADPFRLVVLKAITAQLKTITPTNGFEHDLSDFIDAAGRTQARVFRGRTEYGNNDPLPMLSILEDPRAVEATNGPDGSPMAANTLKLLIQGFVKDDVENPLDPAYLLSAETITALVRSKSKRFDILSLGHKAPCVMNIEIGQPAHRPPDDEVSAVAYFLIGVTLTLAENLEAPYGN